MAPRLRIGPLALALGTLLAPIAVVLAPRDGATVIVLASNPAAAAEAVGRADGMILGPFGRFGLLARSQEPGFATRLYRSGAMIVLASTGSGCLGLPRDTLSSVRRPI